MRSIRNQPFCWQEKKINRKIRKIFSKKRNKVKMLLLYATLTEMDSDFNGKPIKYYTKTINTYSGLSKDFIPYGIRELEIMGVLEIIEDKDKGRFKGKRIRFTPDNIPDTPRWKKADNGKSENGF